MSLEGMGANSMCQWVWPKRSEWTKGKEVGCGSFGTVHLAMNKSTGGIFVVKSPHSGAGREASAKEVNILKALNSSPYIVKCLGTEEEQGRMNIFMEYMEGGNLSDVAQRFGGSLEEGVIRVYTREILHGLKHLHKNGIVHCDLKCKNVLLGSSGNIKLADFGCAKRVKDSAGCIGGTPLWMAPEVLRNESVDFAADIWSLGCTVIEMATGTPPWARQVSNPLTAVLSIALGHDIPLFPPHFSKEGFDFLSECLERDPCKRSSVDQLLAHPFVSTTLPHYQQQFVFSPTSVLDVQNFNHAYDLDVLESSEENHHFSFSCHRDPPSGIAMCKQEDNSFGSSGMWITVRSG
ncbi:hypothetical protein Fmac_010220 [Flemingia macrophylla]|uniref:Protein kinase domain-containing protein n=1 Tax=Flemingia macrophylla TaxID=520843 RepID=A0ABD1N2H6_9FABA